MSFIAKTMFELANSDASFSKYNVNGKYGTNTGASFGEQDCSAGFIVVPNGKIPIAGYESIVDTNGNPKFLNGATFYMNAATDGNSGGMYGDHTGLYFSNTYDVHKVRGNNSSDNSWNLGFETLGLGIPAGEIGDFTEVIIHERYAVGAGNFSTLPADATYLYATILNGLLVATDTLPAGGTGVYFDLEPATRAVTEGASYWGEKYYITAKRTAEVAE